MSLRVYGLAFTDPEGRGIVLADGLTSVQLTDNILRGEDDDEIARLGVKTLEWIDMEQNRYSDIVIEVEE